MTFDASVALSARIKTDCMVENRASFRKNEFKLHSCQWLWHKEFENKFIKCCFSFTIALELLLHAKLLYVNIYVIRTVLESGSLYRINTQNVISFVVTQWEYIAMETNNYM